MLGAIIGDIVGSIYEFDNLHSQEFPLFSPNCFFTDDTIMTFAVAEALRKTQTEQFKNLGSQVIKEIQKFGKFYPDADYGMSFRTWLKSESPTPYYSYGNGAAMRVSPVAYFAANLSEVKKLSRTVTSVSHNHPEGIKGAEATAVATWLSLKRFTKDDIRNYIEKYYYDLNFDYYELCKSYTFNETCQNTVPQAIYCFLISNSFEHCMHIAVSIGGDSDTVCAIAGAIAGAYYGISTETKTNALSIIF